MNMLITCRTYKARSEQNMLLSINVNISPAATTVFKDISVRNDHSD